MTYPSRYSQLFFLLGVILLLSMNAGNALANPNMRSYKIVKLQSLNKATARTSEFEVQIGKTVKLGPLYIRPQTCQKPPTTERQDAITFLQVW